MQELQRKLTLYLHKHRLLKAGDRVGAAVSGGADSLALLRLLLELRGELGIVLSVVHFNHQLRGAEADRDAAFVADLAQHHGVELHLGSGNVPASAAEKKLSVEAAARELRYGFFFDLLRAGTLDRIATAHTLDDQAETVLLRLARGAGTRGLAGIHPQLSDTGFQFSGGFQLSAFSSQKFGCVIRPLLAVRRVELLSYLKDIGQNWREDPSNLDVRFARNRVRHGILPMLEANLNPAIKEALAETAEIARAEEEYWAKASADALPVVWVKPELKIQALLRFPLALQRRLLRAAATDLGMGLEFQHVEGILAVAGGEAVSAELPGGWRVRRRGKLLVFDKQARDEAKDYQYALSVPGAVEVMELGTRVEAVLMRGGGEGYNPDNLLDAARLPAELQVRNWRAGDRYWPAHSKGPKKIKELLQDRQVGGVERRLWPVVTSHDGIVWVRGFPPPQRLQAQPGTGEAVAIREIRTEGGCTAL